MIPKIKEMLQQTYISYNEQTHTSPAPSSVDWKKSTESSLLLCWPASRLSSYCRKCSISLILKKWSSTTDGWYGTATHYIDMKAMWLPMNGTMIWYPVYKKTKHTSLYLPSSRQVQTKSNVHWIIFINFLNKLHKPYCYRVRSEVLTSVSVNTVVFRKVVPCSMMQVHRCFTVTSCLHPMKCQSTSIGLQGITSQKTAFLTLLLFTD